jgi:hypothetical protein
MLKNLIVDGITEKQKALLSKHGTPAGFAQSCYDLVPVTISVEEARAAVEKYQSEWDEAGEPE